MVTTLPPAASGAGSMDGDDASSDAPIVLGWVVFFVGIIAAAAIDLFFVSRAPSSGATDAADKSEAKTSPVLVRQILFWLVAGGLFDLFVLSLFGISEAGGWAYGYALEYLLSVDNLFVFQMVFKSYSTPHSQIDRALFWGISVAVGLRIVFFGVGTEVLALGLIPRLIFGFALVYSGFKTLKDGDDDDEDDPRDNPLIKCISRMLPMHDGYTADASFFVRGLPPAEDKAGLEVTPTVFGQTRDIELQGLTNAQVITGGVEGPPSPSESASAPSGALGAVPGDNKLRVTLLFLVVTTLGIIDIVFAVDSVTAKISSVNQYSTQVNFFLNLTSSAFSMFVLRTLYFVVDALVHMFRFLNYGVGVVLMFIGVKLMIGEYFEIGMGASCLSILSVLGISILASAVLPKAEKEESTEADAGTEVVAAGDSSHGGSEADGL